MRDTGRRAIAFCYMSELLKQRIALCEESLTELESIFPEEYDGLFTNRLMLPSVERYFQLVVDSAVDCNDVILELKNARKPETYFGTFTALRDEGLLTASIAETLAPSVGLRNALVHRYEKIGRRPLPRPLGRGG
jgi:uncharacterized protein YutE (UPF0331/DUF86 family)